MIENHNSCEHTYVYYFEGSKDARCVKCHQYFLGQSFDASEYEKTNIWHRKKEKTDSQDTA